MGVARQGLQSLGPCALGIGHGAGALGIGSGRFLVAQFKRGERSVGKQFGMERGRLRSGIVQGFCREQIGPALFAVTRVITGDCQAQQHFCTQTSIRCRIGHHGRGKSLPRREFFCRRGQSVPLAHRRNAGLPSLRRDIGYTRNGNYYYKKAQ